MGTPTNIHRTNVHRTNPPQTNPPQDKRTPGTNPPQGQTYPRDKPTPRQTYTRDKPTPGTNAPQGQTYPRDKPTPGTNVPKRQTHPKDICSENPTHFFLTYVKCILLAMAKLFFQNPHQFHKNLIHSFLYKYAINDHFISICIM